MIPRLLMVLTLSCSAHAARPGRAEVAWISSSAKTEPGKALQTAIRMAHDEGWRSYWINPGEAGMPTTARWKLPPGWKCGGLELPAPIRLMSGGLAGYGYEGTVLFPVEITPPADFTGEACLSVTLTWLACGEDGCVPGEKELHLDFLAASHVATEHEATIRKAREMLPKPRDGIVLEVSEKGDKLALVITPGSAALGDLSACDVFPATPEVLDPQAEIRFRKDGARWLADAPLGEFVKKPVARMELVLKGGGPEPPLLVKWSAPP
jgi:DsbC/DsbD-like thiol-disulfide interchange protein